jgi:hypothetical protein
LVVAGGVVVFVAEVTLMGTFVVDCVVVISPLEDVVL